VGALAVLFLAIVAFFVFTAFSSIASGINGGGNHQEKAQAMMARADNVPESDWELVGRSDPKVEIGCLSIDIACVRLNATWSVTHKVSLEDAASRLGMEVTGPPMGRFTGCIKADNQDGSTDNICINPARDKADTWIVSINLTAK
jgi:hypothetical protein